MMYKDNVVKLELKSIGENVAIARMTLGSFLMMYDVSLSELDEIKIALSEAVSNSIIHGYGNHEDGVVRIIFAVQNDELTICVEDDGVGSSNIEQAMEPAFSTKMEHMGLGFVFMQTFMDKLTVESEIGVGTRVTMQKALLNQEASEPQAM